MSWIVSPGVSQETLAGQLRELLAEGPIVKMPGAHDGMAGLVARQVGFTALYLSGAAYAASRGLPDVGLVTSSEMADRARDIIRATGLPVLVDVDTGYGGVLNVARMAREMVEAGVAAVQIEDQSLPKKCGHLNGKTLISTSEMVQKIVTIKKVAPTLLVVARTDARGVEGFPQAVERARAYRACGADVIFPEALGAAEEFRQMADMVQAPLLANMTEFGRTPYYSADQFATWGYRIVIYPASSLRVAAKAYEQLYAEIHRTGTQQAFLSAMQTRQELYDVIKYFDYEDLDQNIAKTVLPEMSADGANP